MPTRIPVRPKLHMVGCIVVAAVSFLALMHWPAQATAATSSDLAAGRPVVASSVESSSLPASNVVDGNLSTRWSSAFSDPQWIYVDLGSTYKITEVVLNWEVAYGKAYQIQVSNDASKWTTIYSTTTGTGGVNDLKNLSGTGRYVRMYGTTRGTGWGYSLWGLSVYGSPANLAAGRPAAASSVWSTTYPASNVVDGNPLTRWSSAFSDPQWIYVDLGATYNVTEVVLNWEVAYSKAYQIQVSPDLSKWTTIYSTTTGTGGVNDLTKLSGSGRYVRMYSTARGTGWGSSLWEMSVYDKPVAATTSTATTTTTTTTTSTPSATTTTTTTTTPTTTTTTTPTTTTTTSSSATTTAPANVPTHIPTWAYDDACGGGQGTGASAALVRQWVTFAESNCGMDSTKVLSDCHAGGVTYCTAVQYLDANWIYAQGSLPVAKDAQESWWLHQPGYTDAAHRLSIPAYGGGNILNQTVPAVASWFQNYARSHYNTYDALMMDDTSGSLSNLTWNTGFSTSHEITTDPQLQAAHNQMAAAMTHTDGRPFLQIDNGLSPNNNLSPPFAMLNDQTGVRGMLTEGSPIANGQLVGFYSTLLDEMAYINQTANGFAVLLSYDPAGSLQARRIQAATILLGYSEGHTVSWSDLETNSNHLAIWPEEGIVPTNPIQTMNAPAGTDCLTGRGSICTTGGHNNIQVAPNIYRREFAACYNQGAPIGPCATIVNTTPNPITTQAAWLTQPYTHQITLNGGDVQSGGTINPTGATYTPATTTIPAHDAILLTR